MARLTNDQAVRVFLASQGFMESRPSGRVDARHFAKLIRRLRLLQIDSVNVLTRAHYLPVFARLGSYDRTALDRWIYDGRNMFEYWCHEQSYAPMSFQPMMRTRMRAVADKPWKRIQELRDTNQPYIDQVLGEVVDRGPVSSRELSDPGQKTGPWWGYGKGKIALDWLFSIGAITVDRRVNFERFYDAPERVFPADVLEADDPSPEESDRARIREAVVALGIGTVADLADFFRMRKTETARAIEWLVAQGELVEVEVPEWGATAYMRPDTPIPRRRRGVALLAPFDTMVWDRARTERMFDFHYRIEIYTPAPKRVYGYYVLPFMVDGRLVGRVDLKADRQAGILRAQGVYAEDGVDREAAGRALAGELQLMAAWLGLGEVAVARKGNLAADTARAL